MDAMQMLVDEVALEGLDGITIHTLWIRLENRIPKFPVITDPPTKEFLWRALVCNQDMEFYELPQERPPVVLFDRFAEVDPETGVQEIRRVMPSVEPKDIYPVHVIQQDKNGIQGSCLFLKERKKVTGFIRTKDLQPSYTLEDAFKRWGHKLVVVASQEVRYRALIGLEGDSELKLNDYSYCILERLGRARWQGELQRDLHIRAFKTDAGKMHYLRRSLDKYGLITHQSHVIRQPTGAQQYSILLLLKRFHVDRRNKYDILMEKTSKILSTCPGKTGVMINLRDQLQLSEGTFKRVYQYMMAAKLVQIVSIPLKKLNPDAGPCKTKKGKDIMVRCLKLLKNYKKNEDEDDDDDDNNEEDSNRKPPQSESCVMERDTVTNAYEIVISSGTKGISQSALRERMNIGKLEGRMICRLLERNQMIKGFMEDEGRQRTTKYISKIFVEQSELNQQFAKEKARSEQLMTGAAAELGQKDANSSSCTVDEAQDHSWLQQKGQVKKISVQVPMPKTPKTSKTTNEGHGRKGSLKQSKLNVYTEHSTPIKGKMLPSFKEAEELIDQLPAEGISMVQEDPSFIMDSSLDRTLNVSSFSTSIDDEDCVTVVEEVVSQKEVRPLKTAGQKRIEKPHQTYRLLKRKNLIIETVRNLKVIESLYALQKMIMDEEKQAGVSTKCCKKSILRLLSSLSREGVLKLFRTTVIQDGISKKVEFVVHPSIAPDDPLVKSAIEQIRFRISSSAAALRSKTAHVVQAAAVDKEEKGEKNTNSEKGADSCSSKNPRSKTDEMMGVQQLKDFKPPVVPGLGRSLGFQPKIPRLKVVHSFLWYLVYGHSMRRSPQESKGTEEDGSEPGHSEEVNEKAVQDRMSPRDGALDNEAEKTSLDAKKAEFEETQTVYADELTWRRYIPPTPLHREFGYGWALTSDILLSIPLSIFVKIIQISYKIDDLETYLNDPVKQHYLIRFLPNQMKKQLLYKRRYIFSFYESMQRLCYMGLLHFGPTEKFQDKDQVFIYLKKKATIVDTTTCEPHYNLARSSRPFEQRFYTFSTSQDVENYWFDLQCVCLNTPLGVIRWPRTKAGSEEEAKLLPVEHERPEQRYARLGATLRGSREVTDEGITPGDGQGAGGLDSCFFAHLKRNWLWTSYLLSKPRKTDSTFESSPTIRLKNLLKKHPLPLSMCGAGKVNAVRDSPCLPVMEEDVQVKVESSDRNPRVVGGKKQKRKRLKAAVKPPKKKKKVVNQEKKPARLRFHDEADRSALERMTRLRVIWTVQEDSLLMLCRVASHFLNRKASHKDIKKPFVPWQVVRDLLHAQFEESLDKTSLSVGRRSRYIMKNPQTNLNFKICLAEVYQDKALIENFQNRKNNYDDPEVCASEFKEFVAVLRQKFSTVSDDCDFCIPDTKEELFRRFKVYAIGENSEESRTDVLTSVEDIHSLVLNNLIQSTLVLSNSQMKSYLSFQTFHVYNRYKQTALETAFLKCQKRGLVNRRRVNNIVGPKKIRGVPFLPMSYQLSQTYFRCFSWRFPSTTCTEAFEFLEMLQSVGRQDRPNLFLFQDQEGEQSASDPTDMVLFSLDSPGGACVASLSLMMMGLLSVELSIPEHIVVVDSTLVDNEVVKSMSKDVTEDDDDDDEVEETDGRKKVEVKARQASHTNYLLMRGYCVPGIVSMRNLNTNDNIVVNSCTMRLKLRQTPSHQLFSSPCGSVLDDLRQGEDCLPASFARLFRPCQDTGRLERFSSWCIHRCGYSTEDLQAVLEVSDAIESADVFGCDCMDLARTFSHLQEAQDGRTRTLWQYLDDLINLEEVVEVGGNSLRFVAVKSSDPWLVHSRKRLPMKNRIVQLHDPLSRKRTLESREGEDNEQEAQAPRIKRAAVESDVKEVRETQAEGAQVPDQGDGDLVPWPEETAASSQEATGEKRETMSPAERGTPVQEEQKDVESPSSPPVPPVNEEPAQADPSELACLDTQPEGENTFSFSTPSRPEDSVSFVSRPWRIVDGSLNKPVCKGMLEALLFHIMTRPGIMEPLLMEHYRGVLQPVVLLDLLQALEGMGCVQKRYMTTCPKASLFSSPRVTEVRECVRNCDGNIPFYEPTVDCCLRLGKVFPHEDNWNKWVQFAHC
ncbi:general transcription factor 3C polypeptide 1 [Arapaima gigas]